MPTRRRVDDFKMLHRSGNWKPPASNFEIKRSGSAKTRSGFDLQNPLS